MLYRLPLPVAARAVRAMAARPCTLQNTSPVRSTMRWSGRRSRTSSRAASRTAMPSESTSPATRSTTMSPAGVDRVAVEHSHRRDQAGVSRSGCAADPVPDGRGARARRRRRPADRIITSRSGRAPRRDRWHRQLAGQLSVASRAWAVDAAPSPRGGPVQAWNSWIRVSVEPDEGRLTVEPIRGRRPRGMAPSQPGVPRITQRLENQARGTLTAESVLAVQQRSPTCWTRSAR